MFEGFPRHVQVLGAYRWLKAHLETAFASDSEAFEWQEMQGRFQTMSDSIINRIDDMGARIDDLEKSISELIQELRRRSRGILEKHGVFISFLRPKGWENR